MTIGCVNNKPTSPTTKIELVEWELQSEATLQRTASRLRFWTWPYVILFGLFKTAISVSLFYKGDIPDALKEFSFGIVTIGLTWLGRRGAKELSVYKLLPYLIYLLIVWVIYQMAFFSVFTLLQIEEADIAVILAVLIIIIIIIVIIISPPLYLSASLCLQIRLHARRCTTYSRLVEEGVVAAENVLVEGKPFTV